jgi:hypothetical protein
LRIIEPTWPFIMVVTGCLKWLKAFGDAMRLLSGTQSAFATGEPE